VFSPKGVYFCFKLLDILFINIGLGDIIAANTNAPRSWHDAWVAQPIFEKLRTQTPDGFYLVADTAFPCGTKNIKG